MRRQTGKSFVTPTGLQTTGHGWAVDIDRDFEGADTKSSKKMKKNLKRKKKAIEDRTGKKVTIVAIEGASCEGGAYTTWNEDGVLIYISASFWKNKEAKGKADAVMALGKLAHELEHADQGDRTGLDGDESMEEYTDRRLGDEVEAWDIESEYIDNVLDELDDDVAEEVKAGSGTIINYKATGDAARDAGGRGAEETANKAFIGGSAATGYGRTYTNLLGDTYAGLGGGG